MCFADVSANIELALFTFTGEMLFICMGSGHCSLRHPPNENCRIFTFSPLSFASVFCAKVTTTFAATINKNKIKSFILN